MSIPLHRSLLPRFITTSLDLFPDQCGTLNRGSRHRHVRTIFDSFSTRDTPCLATIKRRWPFDNRNQDRAEALCRNARLDGRRLVSNEKEICARHHHVSEQVQSLLYSKTTSIYIVAHISAVFEECKVTLGNEGR